MVPLQELPWTICDDKVWNSGSNCLDLFSNGSTSSGLTVSKMSTDNLGSCSVAGCSTENETLVDRHASVRLWTRFVLGVDPPSASQASAIVGSIRWDSSLALFVGWALTLPLTFSRTKAISCSLLALGPLLMGLVILFVVYGFVVNSPFILTFATQAFTLDEFRSLSLLSTWIWAGYTSLGGLGCIGTASGVVATLTSFNRCSIIALITLT